MERISPNSIHAATNNSGEDPGVICPLILPRSLDFLQWQGNYSSQGNLPYSRDVLRWPIRGARKYEFWLRNRSWGSQRRAWGSSARLRSFASINDSKINSNTPTSFSRFFVMVIMEKSRRTTTEMTDFKEKQCQSNENRLSVHAVSLVFLIHSMNWTPGERKSED